jgi:hypothetical protein
MECLLVSYHFLLITIFRILLESSCKSDFEMIIQNINKNNNEKIENVRLEVKDKIEGNKIGFSFRIGKGQR